MRGRQAHQRGRYCDHVTLSVAVSGVQNDLGNRNSALPAIASLRLLCCRYRNVMGHFGTCLCASRYETLTCAFPYLHAGLSRAPSCSASPVAHCRNLWTACSPGPLRAPHPIRDQKLSTVLMSGCMAHPPVRMTSSSRRRSPTGCRYPACMARRRAS